MFSEISDESSILGHFPFSLCYLECPFPPPRKSSEWENITNNLSEGNEEMGGQNKSLCWDHGMALAVPGVKQKLLLPFFCLVRPSMGRSRRIPAHTPHLHHCSMRGSRTRPTGAIKKKLPSLGSCIGAFMVLGWEVPIYPLSFLVKKQSPCQSWGELQHRGDIILSFGLRSVF